MKHDVLFIHTEAGLNLVAERSRTFNFLEAVNNSDIKAGLLIFCLPKNLKSLKSTNYLQKKNIYILPRFPKRIRYFNRLLLAIYIIIITKFKNYNIHYHHVLFGKYLSLIYLFKRFHLIFDMHGLIAEEYKYIHQEQYDQKQYNTRLKLQEEAIQRSQTVVCVSNSFKKYLEKTHHYSPDRVFSIPMMVDTQSFYFDLELRLKKRKELNLTDKLVFVYSGSLFRWQMIDKVFEIFKIIFDNIYSTHLMILTNDELEIENILYEYNLSVDSVSKYDLEFTEVNSYLNTCDYGFLLRENHIVNNVASPTKYSEYLRCGVKLILTEGIGDFSKLAEDENFGIVLKNLNNSCIIKNEIQNSIGTVTINEKMRCSERISKLLNRDTILEEEIINKIYL